MEETKTTVSLVAFDRIDLSKETKTRQKLSDDAIARYCEAYKARVEMPPPVLFTEDDKKYYIGDGRPRIEAQKRNGLKRGLCDVRPGNMWDALAFAWKSNLDSALPRTVADRGLAVDRMLRDPVRRSWTNAEIARHCGVSDVTVGSHRTKLTKAGEIEPSPVRIDKGARQLDTTNIGAKKRGASRPSPKASESNGPVSPPPPARSAPRGESAPTVSEETTFPTSKPSESETLGSRQPVSDSTTPVTSNLGRTEPQPSAADSRESVDPILVALEARDVRTALARVTEMHLAEEASRHENRTASTAGRVTGGGAGFPSSRAGRSARRGRPPRHQGAQLSCRLSDGSSL